MSKPMLDSPDGSSENVKETFRELHTLLLRNDIPLEIREDAIKLEKQVAEIVSSRQKPDAIKYNELTTTYEKLVGSIQDWFSKKGWLKAAGSTVIVRLLVEVFKHILHM